MNVYVLRIEKEVIGVYKSMDELYEVLNDFTLYDDFDWDLLEKDFRVYYDFGNGFDEEVEIYTFNLK